MTAETEVRVDAAKVVVEEKSGLDMSSYEDLPPPTVGGGTGGVGCNGDGKDDYIFIDRSDASIEDSTEVHVNENQNVSESNPKLPDRGDKGDPIDSDAALRSEGTEASIENEECPIAGREVKIEDDKTTRENGGGFETESNVGVEISNLVNENGDSPNPGDEVLVEVDNSENANGEQHRESDSKVSADNKDTATGIGHDLEPDLKVKAKDGESTLQDGGISDSEYVTVNESSHKSADEVGAVAGVLEAVHHECDRSDNKVISDESSVENVNGLVFEEQDEVKMQKQDLVLEDDQRKVSDSGIDVQEQELDVQGTVRFDSVEVKDQNLDIQEMANGNENASDCYIKGDVVSPLEDDVKPQVPVDNSSVETSVVVAEQSGAEVMGPELGCTNCETQDITQLNRQEGPQRLEIDANALHLTDTEQSPTEDGTQPQSDQVEKTQNVEYDHSVEIEQDDVNEIQLSGCEKDPRLSKDEAGDPERESDDHQSVVEEADPSNSVVQELQYSSECSVETEKHVNSGNLDSEELALESATCNLQKSENSLVGATDQKDPVLVQESEELQETVSTGAVDERIVHASDTLVEERSDSHSDGPLAEEKEEEERQDSEDTNLTSDDVSVAKKSELTTQVVESLENKVACMHDGATDNVGTLMTDKERVEEEKVLERETSAPYNPEHEEEVPEGSHHATMVEEAQADHVIVEAAPSGSFVAESDEPAEVVNSSSKVGAAADERTLHDRAGDGASETTIVNIDDAPRLGGSQKDPENGELSQVHVKEVVSGADVPEDSSVAERRLPCTGSEYEASYSDMKDSNVIPASGEESEVDHCQGHDKEVFSCADDPEESGADALVAESRLRDAGSEYQAPCSDMKDSIVIPDCGEETEVDPGQGLGDSTSDGFANGLNLSGKISFGSFDSEVYAANLSHDDANKGPQNSNGTTAGTSDQQVVADEKSESKFESLSTQATRDLPCNGSVSSHCLENGRENEFMGSEGTETHEVSKSTDEGSVPDASDGQWVNTEMVSRPFHYLIRIPRYDDERHREKIRLAEAQVEERTKRRDAVRLEYQKRKAAIRNFRASLEAARSEERAARDLMRAKRQEIDYAQSIINHAKTALTIEDASSRVIDLERRIQHETVPLSEEKQLIREIKQLKQRREQLSSNASEQQQIQQAWAQKDKVEEQLKVLRKEMDALRENLVRAEAAAKIARKKYDDESASLNELNAQFVSADVVRQEAYADFLSLKRQWSEKSKYFRKYKDDASIANNYVAAGDKESLQRYCVNQVEAFMETWNNDVEFRRDYIKFNMRSTLRRLRTPDGRALGPDEKPPSPYAGRGNIAPKINITKKDPTVECSLPDDIKKDNITSEKVERLKNNQVPTNKALKPQSEKEKTIEAPREIEADVVKEEQTLSKEEEELARKEEESRREQEAARLKEQRRLEEKAKAQEALERKRRNAEKAQARAEFRARKEAEAKEKEREKKAKKKEKKKGVKSDAPPADAEMELATVAESPVETMKELEAKEKPTVVTKRPQRPSIKVRSIPPPPLPLRNRGRRRMQQWIWVFVVIVSLLALFFLGNSKFLLSNRILSFSSTH